MKHTPGPWVSVQNMAPSISIITQADSMKQLAIVYISGENMEGEYNAKLITAAPNLLKALRGMVDAYEYEASANNSALLFAKEVLSEVDGE